MTTKTFYLCLNQHQRDILLYKNIQHEIVTIDDLEVALFSGVKKIILFNDTIPRVHNLLRRYSVEVELWQEGLIPFFGLSFNKKSFIRNSINSLFGMNLMAGYKPYFYNGIETIVTAYDPEYLRWMGVKSKNIIYNKEIFSYKNNTIEDAPYPLYLATDFYSEGLVIDHNAQIKNFYNIRNEIPNIKLRPHPKEVKLFLKELSENSIETKYSYSKNVYGSISTALYINKFRGSSVIIDLKNHSHLIKKAYEKNVDQFVGSMKLF